MEEKTLKRQLRRQLDRRRVLARLVDWRFEGDLARQHGQAEFRLTDGTRGKAKVTRGALEILEIDGSALQTVGAFR